jgi:hypothetical protein
MAEQGSIELKAFIQWLKTLPPDEELFWTGEPATTSPIAVYLMRKNKPPCTLCKVDHHNNVYVRVDMWGFTKLNERNHYTDYTSFPKWAREIHSTLPETPAQVLVELDKLKPVKKSKDKKKKYDNTFIG